MFQYEALVRSRIQEYEREARRRQLVREVTAGRQWARLARFAAKRTEHARRGR